MFRFFIAFQAQPRLGVVTGTLQSCFVDMFHFLLVLGPTFFAYATMASFIFGRRIERFSTLQGSVGACFKMLTECEYSWSELSKQDYWTVALWVWSFMLVLSLLMLNMVLAIVMDVYTEMRKNAGNSEAVWTTVQNLFIWARYRKIWVPSEVIVPRLASMPPLITLQDLMKAFPGMCVSQMMGLATESCNCVPDGGKAGNGVESALGMQMAVLLSMEQVEREVNMLVNYTGPKQIEGFRVIHGSDKGWVQHVSERMAFQNHYLVSFQWKLQQLQWQWQTLNKLNSTGHDPQSSEGYAICG